MVEERGGEAVAAAADCRNSHFVAVKTALRESMAEIHARMSTAQGVVLLDGLRRGMSQKLKTKEQRDGEDTKPSITEHRKKLFTRLHDPAIGCGGESRNLGKTLQPPARC